MLRKFGILVNFGTEIRPFFENGLSLNISYKYDVVFIIRNNPLIPLLSEGVLKKSILIERDLIKRKKYNFLFKLFLKFDTFFSLQRKSRQRKLDFGNYHFTTGTNFKLKVYDIVFGLEFLYVFFRKIYFILSPRFFYSQYLVDIYSENNITDLLYYGSNSYDMRHFVQTAKILNIKLWHYVGNWKDIYIDDFISIKPNKLFVWSSKMKIDLLKLNSHIENSSVVISGNLFFYKYLDYSPQKNRKFYYDKYNIQETSDFFLWPLSMNVIFPNEHLLIAKIDDFIENNFKENKPVIVIRDNPFGVIKEKSSFYKQLKNIRIAENFWNVSIKEDFLFQSSEGEVEWTDLLYYCCAVISIPSTVTLESILFKKKSINILFDESGNFSQSFFSFSKAPFYADLHNRNDVIFRKKLDEFCKDICDLNSNLDIQNEFILYPSALEGNGDKNIETFIQNIM